MEKLKPTIYDLQMQMRIQQEEGLHFARLTADMPAPRQKTWVKQLLLPIEYSEGGR